MHSDWLRINSLLCWYKSHSKLKHALKLFYKSKRPHFLWIYQHDNSLGSWENSGKACK